MTALNTLTPGEHTHAQGNGLISSVQQHSNPQVHAYIMASLTADMALPARHVSEAQAQNVGNITRQSGIGLSS